MPTNCTWCDDGSGDGICRDSSLDCPLALSNVVVLSGQSCSVSGIIDDVDSNSASLEPKAAQPADGSNALLFVLIGLAVLLLLVLCLVILVVRKRTKKENSADDVEISDIAPSISSDGSGKTNDNDNDKAFSSPMYDSVPRHKGDTVSSAASVNSNSEYGELELCPKTKELDGSSANGSSYVSLPDRALAARANADTTPEQYSGANFM